MSKAKKQSNFLPKNAQGPYAGGKDKGKKKSKKHTAQFAKNAKPKGKVS